MFWKRNNKSTEEPNLPKDGAIEAKSPPRRMSQHTVAVMIGHYERLFQSRGPYRALGPIFDIDRFRNSLFAMGLQQQFLDRCEFTYHWHFASLFPALHNGTFFGRNTGYAPAWAEGSGQSALHAFATALCGLLQRYPEHRDEDSRVFYASLLSDGFQFVGNRLIETNQDIVEEAKEISAVEALIRSSIHDNQKVLLHHFTGGNNLFVNGSYHASVNEWRSFLEEVLRGVSRTTRAHRSEFATYAASPNMKDLFTFLHKAGFFNSDEQLAFSSTWAFLSAGGHPGISERDDAHLSMILSLTFSHAALLKLHSWRQNSCVRF